MTSVAFAILKNAQFWNSGHERQTDDVLVKLLHCVQIVNAECDLAEAAHQHGLALVSRLCLQRPCGMSKVRRMGAVSRRCESISLIFRYCSRW